MKVDMSFIDDDGKLKERYFNKRINAQKEGIGFSLTFSQYCAMVSASGYKSSELGFHPGSKNVVLARYNDTGDYKVGNCRFITQAENAKERITSDASRSASVNNMIKYNTSLSPEAKQKQLTNAGKASIEAKSALPPLLRKFADLQISRLAAESAEQRQKVSDDDIRNAHAPGISINRLCLNVGLSPAGNNYNRIRRVLGI